MISTDFNRTKYL